MKELLSNLWHDPVGGPVISAVISAAIIAAFSWLAHALGLLSLGWLRSEISIPTWSVVLAFALVVLGAIAIVSFVRSGPVVTPSAKVRVTDENVTFDKDAYYPLKCYVNFKNESLTESIDVQMCGYKPKAIKIKKLELQVLQVMINDVWEPKARSVERVAVFPGQRFCAWVAFDDQIYKKEQLEAQVGTLGTMTLTISGKEREFQV